MRLDHWTQKGLERYLQSEKWSQLWMALPVPRSKMFARSCPSENIPGLENEEKKTKFYVGLKDVMILLVQQNKLTQIYFRLSITVHWKLTFCGEIFEIMYGLGIRRDTSTSCFYRLKFRIVICIFSTFLLLSIYGPNKVMYMLKNRSLLLLLKHITKLFFSLESSILVWNTCRD